METVTLRWGNDTKEYEWERLAGKYETRLEKIFRKRFAIPEEKGITIYKKFEGGKRRIEKKQVEPGKYGAEEDDWPWITMRWQGQEGKRRVHRSTAAADILSEIRKYHGISRRTQLRLLHSRPGKEERKEPWNR